MKPIEFHLNEFKAMARWLDSKLPAWLAFFVKGWLWKLEDSYIDAKAASAVSRAVREYNEGVDIPEGLTPHTIDSEPSEVEGLDTISIHSTWEKD